MLQVIESKYLRDRYNKFIEEYKELYNKVLKLMEEGKGEDARWNKRYMIKDIIKEFKSNSEMSYEEYVKSHLLLDMDVAIAIKEYDDYSLVVYRIMEKIGCTYGDARDYHYSEFVEYLEELYDKMVEIKDKYGDVVIDKDMVENIKSIDLWIVEGIRLGDILRICDMENLEEIEKYLDKVNK